MESKNPPKIQPEIVPPIQESLMPALLNALLPRWISGASNPFFGLNYPLVRGTSRLLDEGEGAD
jgi:hypothetical protein